MLWTGEKRKKLLDGRDFKTKKEKGNGGGKRGGGRSKKMIIFKLKQNKTSVVYLLLN